MRTRVRLAAVGFAVFAAAIVAAFPSSPRAQAQQAGPPRGEPRPDKALVYFLRDEAPPDDRYWIFDDTTLIAVLRRNSYAFSYLDPGPHLLWDRPTTSALPQLFGRRVFNFEAGRMYYLLLENIGYATVKELTELQAIAGNNAVAGAERFLIPTAKEIRKASRIAAKGYGGASPPPRAPGEPVRPATPVAAAGAAAEGRVKIPAGTAIVLELAENVTSFHVEPAARVRFRLAEDLQVDGRAVLRAEHPVDGFVGQRTAADVLSSRPGFLDVEIPEVKFPDGGSVATLGLMTTSVGRDLSGQYFAQIGLGAPIVKRPAFRSLALPGFFLKGGDPWLLAGMRAAAYTRRDAWVVPTAGAAGEHEREPDTAGAAVSATNPPPIRIPRIGRLKGDCVIHVASKSAPRDVKIASVSGGPVPVKLAPTAIENSDDGWDLTFARWDMVRFGRLGPLRNEVPVVLSGVLADQSRFTASVTVVLEIEPAD